MPSDFQVGHRQHFYGIDLIHFLEDFVKKCILGKVIRMLLGILYLSFPGAWI